MPPDEKRKVQVVKAVEKLTPEPAPKRIKTETIAGNADAATRAASALDAATVPDTLRCPICMEIPLEEVYQCPNGHPICQECQLKSGKVTCSQCQEAMQTASGRWIRNRMMEQHLDSHWFLCPFRNDGCPEVLSREDVQNHKNDCIYDGMHVQICKYFDNTGLNCQYWTNILNPKDSFAHLSQHFNFMSTVSEEEDMSFWFPVNLQMLSDYVQAAVAYLKNGAALMIIGWSMKRTGILSFVCLRMDNPRPGPGVKLVRLTFENQKRHFNAIPNMSLTLPVVLVSDANPVLEDKLMCATNRHYLYEHYLDSNFEKPYANCVKVKIDIIGVN